MAKAGGSRANPQVAIQQRTFAFNQFCFLMATNDEPTIYGMCKTIFSGKAYIPPKIVLEILIKLTNLGMISSMQAPIADKNHRPSASPLLASKLAELERLLLKHRAKLKPKTNSAVEFHTLHFLSGCGFLAAAIQLGKVREKMSLGVSQNAKGPKTFSKKASTNKEELIESS